MKKYVLSLLLYIFITFPAQATENPANVGLSFGANSALGIHGEFDVSSSTNNAPVSAQIFLKNFSQNISYVDTWNTTGIGAAGIYDFNAKYQLDKKIHPYAGVGLIYVFHKWTGFGPERTYTGKKSGLYVTAGVRYFLTPHVAADFNYNNFGTMTAGINLDL